MPIRKIFRNTWINTTVKIVILGLLSWAIYEQVIVKEDLNMAYVINHFRNNFTINTLLGLVAVFVLMLVNWGLEALKWKTLVVKMEPISYFKAFKAVLAGLTFAVFTPNRIGEYAGRIFYLKREDRIKGILVTLIGSLSQIIVTMILGMVGLVFYLQHNEVFDIRILYLIMLLFLLLIVLAIGAYFNVGVAYNLLKKIVIFKKLRTIFRVFTRYSAKELSKVFLYSFLRYSVFTAQYLLLLWAYGVKVPTFKGLYSIAVIYLAQSVIPTITLVELGVRGNVALYFFEQFATNSTTNLDILAASYTLWLINLILPAMIGGLLVIRINFFKLGQND